MEIKKNLNILFWGNSGNYPYQLAKMLRKNHNVEMFLMKSDNQWVNNNQDDKELNSSDWIKEYDNTSFLKATFINKAVLKYINNNFDIAIVCGVSIQSAFNFKIPYVIFPTGGEINSSPFLSYTSFLNPKVLLTQIFYNIAIQKSQKILSTADGFNYHLNAYSRLKHKGVVNCYAPIDQNYIHSLIDHKLLEKLNKKYSEYRLVVLWLNRCNMEPNTPSFKDPNLFLDSIFKVLQNYKNIKVIYARHGRDLSHFEDKIKKSGLNEFFESVPYLKSGEYQTYLSIKNALVVDSLAPNGAYNSNVMRESLALKTPISANYDDDIYFVYPECYPVFRVNKGSDLEEIINKLYKWSENDREEYKNKVQIWFDKYMCHNAVIKNYERELKYSVLLNKYKNTKFFPLSLFGKNKI